MQNCANCGHQNRPGVVYCENCGASLLGEKPLSTKSIGSASEEEKAQMGFDSSVLTDVKVQGVSAFSMDDTLRLEIEGSPEPIIFKPKSETIFGRRDPATGAMPDVDLTPFAGYRMGVSRRHAAIRQGEEQSLNLWDLGSSNGTYLNGQKLTAHRPYRLHDGDELRLGQMMVRIRFQIGGEDFVIPAAKPAEGQQSSRPQPAEAKPTAKPASDQPPVTDELSQAAIQVASQAPSIPAPTQQPVSQPDDQAAKPAESDQPVQAAEEKKADPIAPVGQQTLKAAPAAASPAASQPTGEKPAYVKPQQADPTPDPQPASSEAKAGQVPDQNDSGSNPQLQPANSDASSKESAKSEPSDPGTDE